MKLHRFLAALIVLFFAIVGALAFYVFSGNGRPADPVRFVSDSTLGQQFPTGESAPLSRRTNERRIHADTQPDRLTSQYASPDAPFASPAPATSTDNGQPESTGDKEPPPTALSRFVAYGPPQAKVDADRNDPASREVAASLPPEVLDASPIAVPMALLDPPKSVASDPQQVAALNHLRKEFSNALGGKYADPESADYRNRWQKAQPDLDARYRLWFGAQAYMAMQQVRAIESQQAGR